MKVIFLDIDGVLVNRKALLSTRVNRHSAADPDCVALLNRIIEETGAHIVVSSTWRMFPNITSILNGDFGVRGSVIGITPELRSGFVSQPRGKEIAAWLAGAKDIESFVIIDDDADMEHLTPRLVKTEFEQGLTSRDAIRAIAMLSEVGL